MQGNYKDDRLILGLTKLKGYTGDVGLASPHQTPSDFLLQHLELKVPSPSSVLLLVALHLLLLLLKLGGLTLLVLLAVDLELRAHTVGLLLHDFLSNGPRMAYKASGLSGRV